MLVLCRNVIFGHLSTIMFIDKVLKYYKQMWPDVELLSSTIKRIIFI